MLLILFHDHWAALSEVPRCHKHHQYSKPLPAASDFRATEGHWYAAVLKRPAPLFWSRSAWLVSPWLNPPDWRTADGGQIFGQRIMSFHPRGVKISHCTYRKCLRSKPGAPKVSILAASTTHLHLLWGQRRSQRSGPPLNVTRQNVQHYQGCLPKQIKARSWKGLINRTNSI